MYFIHNIRILCFSLFFLAFANAVSAVEVINAGIGGNSSTNLLARMNKDVVSHMPSLVVVMVGTNDALNSKKLCSFDKYRSNLEKLVTGISNNDTKIILMTIPPFYEKYLLMRHKLAAFEDSPPQARIESINNIIKEIGGKYNVPVIDIYAIFQKNGGANETHASLLRNLENSNSIDGVHPTVKGYKIIAEAVAENIKKNKFSVKLVICFGDSITYGAGVEQGRNSYPVVLKRLLLGGTMI